MEAEEEAERSRNVVLSAGVLREDGEMAGCVLLSAVCLPRSALTARGDWSGPGN